MQSYCKPIDMILKSSFDPPKNHKHCCLFALQYLPTCLIGYYLESTNVKPERSASFLFLEYLLCKIIPHFYVPDLDIAIIGTSLLIFTSYHRDEGMRMIA